jgi:hypothetical protein
MSNPLKWHERIWLYFHFALYLAYMFSGQGHIHDDRGLIVGIYSAVLAGAVVGIPTILINKRIFRTERSTIERYLLTAGVIFLSIVAFAFLELFVALSIYFPWRGG